MEGKPDWLSGFPVQIYCNSSDAVSTLCAVAVGTCGAVVLWGLWCCGACGAAGPVVLRGLWA